WMAPLTIQLHRVLEKLDSVLLAPLRPLLRHDKLILVPHGLLHQLPFHLLRSENRYLLERCESRIVPTARLVQREGRAPQPGSTGQTVVVSHSWDGQLQQALAEGRMVAEILGGATLLEGKTATRAALLELMRGANILHIAAHGEHRPDAPHFSHIHLEDGLLNAADLFLLSLRASLVTLSACDTGQVQVRAGDDPVGLWRGFLAAGAQSLLVALWQLEDESALQLMRHFYETLMASVPKVAALRSVQQAWLASAEGRLAHPFYWGALQLIGDDGPLLR
ncbi:MAG: CHAT domain-containing protein, partial [Ardenticatenales bacterium]|nr:CHAT domain-containing protein [Ardenticatenales bacterium]